MHWDLDANKNVIEFYRMAYMGDPKPVVAESDLVALHTRQTWPVNEEYVTMGFSVSIKKEKLLNIGMLFKIFQRNQKMVTQCITILENTTELIELYKLNK